MHITEAVSTISEFWEAAPLPFTGGGTAHLERLQQEFSLPLPDELRTYVREFAPKTLVTLERVGNPIELYGLEGRKRLAFEQYGYNTHDITGERFTTWNDGWFLLADRGADPIIIGLSRGDTQVLQAMHGSGAWNFLPIADTLGQFLLCATAVHHTLARWPEDPDDDNDGDDLSKPAADWLFPRMREWAGAHYDRWCGDFTNS